MVTPDEVAKENPEYGVYVARQVANKGRNHPLVKTQYFNEEIDSEDGMFPPARRALMRGSHARRTEPEPGRTYALLLDVAGEDEGASGGRLDLAALDNPRRDSTVLTVVEVDLSTLGDPVLRAPTYRAVQRLAWTGVKHSALYGHLRALALHWRARYFVADATGVGAGLVSFLERALPAGCVIRFEFNAATKSELGWDFIGLCDTGRWQDYAPEQAEGAGDVRPAVGDFWRELEFCQYEALPGEKQMLRWGVPDGTRDPATGELVHDDALLSAALAAVLDRQPWHADTGPTHIIRAADPLDSMNSEVLDDDQQPFTSKTQDTKSWYARWNEPHTANSTPPFSLRDLRVFVVQPFRPPSVRPRKYRAARNWLSPRWTMRGMR